jgi:hypothetical protein
MKAYCYVKLGIKCYRGRSIFKIAGNGCQEDSLSWNLLIYKPVDFPAPLPQCWWRGSYVTQEGGQQDIKKPPTCFSNCALHSTALRCQELLWKVTPTELTLWSALGMSWTCFHGQQVISGTVQWLQRSVWDLVQ